MRRADLFLAGVSAVALSIGVFLPSIAFAAGFYIQEQSVSALGAANAGVAAHASDASTIFFIPAGMTQLDGRQINLGVHALLTNVEMEDTGTSLVANGAPIAAVGIGPNNDGGNPGGLNFIPNAYFATPITENGQWWAGFGVSAPFGLGSEYDDEFFGRFSSVKTELRTIDFQPALAYRPVDWLSIGVSAVIEYADANLQQFALTSAPPTPQETYVRVTGDDWSVGYNAGIILTPREGTDFGISYRSEIQHQLVGDVDYSIQNAAIGAVNSDAQADLDIPDILHLGWSQKLGDQWTLLAGATWMGWNSFDNLLVEADNPGTRGPSVLFNYQTTWAYQIGAEYAMNENWTLRAGYQFDETPTTNEGRSTLNPDGDRHWFSGGFTYKMDDKWSVDIAATYIDIDENPVNIRRGAININSVSNDAYAAIGAIGINYKF